MTVTSLLTNSRDATGYGKVNGRVVFASSQDFTVGGGALGEYHARKICNAMDMAMDARAPFVEINDSGYMEFIGKKDPLLFREGDVTCIPRNIPHTTYSSPGTESHWSYLFIDPAELFHNISPNFGRDFDLSLPAFKNYKHILSRDEYPQVYQLTMAVIKEMEEKKPHYQTSVTGLLLALSIELYRIQSEGGSNIAPTNQPPENARETTDGWR